jgi:hypothetical protein
MGELREEFAAEAAQLSHSLARVIRTAPEESARVVRRALPCSRVLSAWRAAEIFKNF